VKYRQRLQSLLAVDQAVGRLIRLLRERHQLDRTVIMFTSDNGFLLGEHRVATGKDLPYEESIRVPMLVRGPGIPRGLRLTQLTANTDLAPTIVDLARARPDLQPDGRSLMPLLRDPGLEWGRDILLEHGPGEALVGPRLYTGLRTPRYAYLEYSTGERELYDLNADPDELANATARAEDKVVESELGRRLRELRDCAGAPCRRGPALSFAAVSEGACAKASVRVRIGGADQRLIEYVDFIVGSRHVPDVAAPFEQVVKRPSVASGQWLRALVVLIDGRRVTLDRELPACR
jgi:hypothetical protein